MDTKVMELLRVQGSLTLSARYGYLFGPSWADLDFEVSLLSPFDPFVQLHRLLAPGFLGIL